MASRGAQRRTSFALSVLGHAAIVAALMFSVPLSQPQRSTAPNVVPIDTVMIDQSVVAAEMARIEQAEQAAIQREEEEAQRLRDETERLLREQEDRERQLEEDQRELVRIQREQEEAARVAEEERLARLEQERREREDEEQEREQERLAALERQRVEDERLRREAEERAKQAQVEGELAAALAAEDEARRARESGLLDQYVRSIEDKIKRNWNRPASAGPDLECVLIVTQIPSGEVTGVSIDSCNGDSAVVRSIENAVLSASPLPRPPVASLFQRVIRVRFKPDE